MYDQESEKKLLRTPEVSGGTTTESRDPGFVSTCTVHSNRSNNAVHDRCKNDSRLSCVYNNQDYILDHAGGPGVIQPPATSTQLGRQLPSLSSPSDSSGPHLHLQPTPFSFSSSHSSQYASSSILFFSSVVVVSRYGGRGSCRAFAFAGQCAIVVCR